MLAFPILGLLILLQCVHHVLGQDNITERIIFAPLDPTYQVNQSFSVTWNHRPSQPVLTAFDVWVECRRSPPGALYEKVFCEVLGMGGAVQRECQGTVPVLGECTLVAYDYPGEVNERIFEGRSEGFSVVSLGASSITSTTSPSNASPSPPIPKAETKDEANADSLPRNSILGLAIGLPIGLLLLIIIITFITRRRRASKKHETQTHDAAPATVIFVERSRDTGLAGTSDKRRVQDVEPFDPDLGSPSVVLHEEEPRTSQVSAPVAQSVDSGIRLGRDTAGGGSTEGNVLPPPYTHS